jgi:hypothetical protein
MRKTLTVLGIVALILAVTGTATGTINRLIHGSDVKNGSLTGRDVDNGSLTGRDLRNRSVDTRDIAGRSITAWRIAKGAVRLLERQRLTATHPTLGINVVDVPGVPTSSGDPNAPNEGVALYPAVRLRAGTYLVQGTTIFFDFTGENVAEVEYGVTQVFVDGQALPTGTNWSADIPDDGNNGASSSGSFVLRVPRGDSSTVQVRAVIRTNEGTPDPVEGHAGGNLIVTKLAAP